MKKEYLDLPSPLEMEKLHKRILRWQEEGYSFPRYSSKDILKKKREKLGLTSAQVATLCRISEKQYLLYESGEKELTAASFRIGLNICYVLQIDPMNFCQAKRQPRSIKAD